MENGLTYYNTSQSQSSKGMAPWCLGICPMTSQACPIILEVDPVGHHSSPHPFCYILHLLSSNSHQQIDLIKLKYIYISTQKELNNKLCLSRPVYPRECKRGMAGSKREIWSQREYLLSLSNEAVYFINSLYTAKRIHACLCSLTDCFQSPSIYHCYKESDSLCHSDFQVGNWRQYKYKGNLLEAQLVLVISLHHSVSIFLSFTLSPD